jgi:hypothetical protein
LVEASGVGENQSVRVDEASVVGTS